MKKAEIINDPCLEPYFETELYSYYIPIDCGDYPIVDPIAIDYDDTPPTYDRDVNSNKDQLNKAEFVSIDAYRLVEPWLSGRPEFKVIVSYIEKVGTTYQAKSIIKILTIQDWVNRYIFWSTLDTKQIDLPIITFDKELIGNSVKYTWIEQDPSNTQMELSITTSSKFGEDDNTAISSSLKVTIGSDDDEAGESVVEYKDGTKGEGTEYNTGIVKFWVNQL